MGFSRVGSTKGFVGMVKSGKLGHGTVKGHKTHAHQTLPNPKPFETPGMNQAASIAVPR